MLNDMRDKLKDLVNKIQYTLFPEQTMKVNLGNQFTEYALNFIVDELIANGVILPPCKVGDTVYCIYKDQVIQGTVRIIRPSISKEEIIFKGSIIVELDSFFYDDDRKEKFELYVVFEKPYGCDRVAYLTKDQAEQKLKEMVGENNA